MIAFKQLIEARRRDELLKILSFLEGKKTHHNNDRVILELKITTSDVDVVRVSQVCRAWRQFIVEIGIIRCFVRKLEHFESKEEATIILKKDFSIIDDVLIYCFMKNLNNSGIVYGWGMNSQGELTGRMSKYLPERIESLKTVTTIIASDNTSFVTKNGE